MKKIYVSLLLLACFVQASEQDYTQVYQQEITDLTQQLTSIFLQEDVHQKVENIQSRVQEFEFIIGAYQNDMDILDNDIKSLCLGPLDDYNDAWLYENSRKFNPYYGDKVHKILECFQTLSYQEQCVQVATSQIVGVITPQDYINYWSSQIHDKQSFENEKNYKLAWIAYYRSMIVARIDDQVNWKKNIEQYCYDVQDYKIQYDDLYQKYLKKFEDICLDKKKNDAVLRIQSVARQYIAQRKENILRQAMLLQAQKEAEQRAELLARQQEAQNRKIIAQQEKALQIHAEKERQRQKNKELLRLQAEQKEKDIAAKKQAQKNNAAGVKNKVNVKDEQLKAEQQAAKEKNDRENLLLDLIVESTNTENYAQIVMDDIKKLLSSPDEKDFAQIEKLYKTARLIPYKQVLDMQLKDYVTNLVLHNHAEKEVKKLTILYKQENEQKLQAQQVEFDAIDVLLQEYRSLIASHNAIDVVRIKELSLIFLEKNNHLIKKYGQGLQHFVGCNAVLYLDLLDSFNYWQRKLQHIILKDTSEDDKHLTQHNINTFLRLLNLLQGEKGILNPTKIFGDKMMAYLQSPDICRCMSQVSLDAMKQSIRDAIAQSNKDTVIEKLTPIMNAGLQELGVFPEQSMSVASHFIEGAVETTQKLTVLQVMDTKLEEHLMKKFFTVYLERSIDDNTLYKRDQLADLARIQSFIVVNLFAAHL